MEFLLFIAAIVGLAWGTLFLLRGSLLVGGSCFLVAACCFSNEFMELGGSLTIERLVLGGLLAAAVVQWKLGYVDLKSVSRGEICLFVFLGLLALSVATHDWRPFGKAPPVIPHLINGYLIPLLVYWIGRHAALSASGVRGMYLVLAAFGLYLSLTALAEINRQWWAVYPTYIANPEIGIHFGRARGPMLQSATLGLYLTACLLATWAALCRGAKSWWGPAITVAVFPLYAAATWVTQTRICWISLGLAVVMVLAATLKGRLRALVLVGAMGCALLVLAAKWDSFVAFKREGASASVTRESTYMRASFAYVSWKMFWDRPVWGFGFSQFNKANRPYLTDPEVSLRLESIRGYVHHNTYLAMLVDMGLIGFTAYLAVLGYWLHAGWRLWYRRGPDYMRVHGLVFLATFLPYLLQIMFHDLSYTAADNAVIYFWAGMATGMNAALDRQDNRDDGTEGNAVETPPELAMA